MILKILNGIQVWSLLPNFESGFTDVNFNQGINYLNETFAQAKIPAMVAALWKVPNLQTKEIMVSFYQHLKKGAPKDVALQNAKKEYLKAHQ